MVIMGMPYVAIISAIVGVTNLAPTFGPMVGAIIGAFILVLVKPWYALAFLLFTLVLQTIDGYVIKPRLFGEQLGVSSVWILISLVIGGRLIGVAGILLAIPFAAIADFVYHDYIIKRLEEQNAEHKKLAEAANAGIEAAGESVAEAAAHITGSAVPAFGVRSIVPTDADTDSDAVRAAGAENDVENDAENGTDDMKDDADNVKDDALDDTVDNTVDNTVDDNSSDPDSDDGQDADADDDIEDSGCSAPGSDDGQAADADGDTAPAVG